MSELTEDQLEGLSVFHVPERSEWSCYLFGNTPDSTGMIWVPNKGCEPNWFWRKMQYLILGNLWEKKEHD